MTSKQSTMDNKDALDDVVTKLSAVSDFLQMLDCSPYLRKRTPDGLSLIIDECIESLNEIGTLHERVVC